MRLLNSGTLNKGRNLWVTVAIDHLTVDGFHDELQPSAKKHQRRFDESVESMNFNWFVGMNIIPFLFFWPFFEIPPIREHSTTRNTLRIRLVRGERKLERNPYCSRPWAVGHDGRIRILLRKAQLEGHDLAQLGDSFEKPKMDNQNLLEEIRPTELQPWQGTTQVRGEVQEDFLAESDGFPPTTKAGNQCTKTRPIQRSAISSPKLLRKCLGKLVMNFFHKQTYAVYHRQVANMLPGLSTTSSLSSLSTPTSPTSTQDIEGSIPDPASIESDSEDRQVRGDPCRNPTNQAMST